MSELRWALLPRFSEYVLNMGDGAILLEGGASEIGPALYAFPQRNIDDRGDARVYSFAGTVRFVGHSGMLNLPVTDPELIVRGDRCELRVSDPDDASHLLFATGRVAASTEGLVAEPFLEEDGSELFFYRYPIGFPLAELRFTP